MIITDRLLLRPWKPSDLVPFAAMNADPRVMEFFPKLLTREESDATVERIRQHFEAHGFGAWAVEIPGIAEFAGFIGLFHTRFESWFTPCVEIGWRLALEHQGKGYATEGAKAALDFGFNELKLTEIFSFTVPANVKSWRVMEKTGMKRIGEFEHPLVEEGSPLKKHVLYKKSNEDR